MIYAGIFRIYYLIISPCLFLKCTTTPAWRKGMRGDFHGAPLHA